MLRRRPMPTVLERLLPRRHETQRREPEGLRGHLRDDEMSVMDRIERPPEEADHLLRKPRPCR
jgi:hypothetical protein